MPMTTSRPLSHAHRNVREIIQDKPMSCARGKASLSSQPSGKAGPAAPELDVQVRLETCDKTHITATDPIPEAPSRTHTEQKGRGGEMESLHHDINPASTIQQTAVVSSPPHACTPQQGHQSSARTIHPSQTARAGRQLTAGERRTKECGHVLEDSEELGSDGGAVFQRHQPVTSQERKILLREQSL